jgi:hypothetical protein
VDLKKYAAQNNLPVKESAYFMQNEDMPEWAGNKKVNEALFELNKGELSDIIELQNKYYVFQILDHKPSYLPELKEVADKVRKVFTDSLLKAEAKKEAENDLARLNKGEAWENLLKDGRFKHATTDFFKRNDEILPELARVPELKEAAFELSQAKRYPNQVFENNQGAFIVRWEGGEGIDPAKYTEEMSRYLAAFQNSKPQILVNSWMEYLKASARIERPAEGKDQSSQEE